MASAAVVAVVLTGCSSGGSSPDPSSSRTLSGVLTFGISTDEDQGFASDYKEFEKKTGVSSTSTASSPTEISNELLLQLPAGTAPDIWRTGASGTLGLPLMATKGYLADLSNESWASKVPKSIRPLLEYKGKLLGYPTDNEAIVMFYNKKAFADAGVNPPKTWNEFITVCKKLKANGVTPISIGMAGGASYNDGFIPWMLVDSLVNGPNPKFDEERRAGKTSFAKSAGWNEALQKFFGLVKSGYTTKDALGTSADVALQDVGSGKAAMVGAVSTSLPTLQKYSSDGPNGIGAFVLPATNNPSDTYVPLSPELIGVYSKAKNAPAAKAFLNFISTPDRTAAFAKATGTLPALTNSKPLDTDMYKLIEPYVKDSHTTPMPHHHWYNAAIQLKQYASGELVMEGKMTIPQMLKSMDALTQKTAG